MEGSFLSFWAQVSRSWSLLMILGHDYLRIFGNILFRIYLASFYLGFFDMLKIYFLATFYLGYFQNPKKNVAIPKKNVANPK